MTDQERIKLLEYKVYALEAQLSWALQIMGSVITHPQLEHICERVMDIAGIGMEAADTTLIDHLAGKTPFTPPTDIAQLPNVIL